MATPCELHIDLIGYSVFQSPVDMRWATDGGPADALVEFAARACYNTFDKPNPRTRTNRSFIAHVKEIGQTAVFEHSSATFYIRGISATAAQELMRHRHLSFSQLSSSLARDAQPQQNLPVVIPAGIRDSEELTRVFLRAMEEAQFMYQELYEELRGVYEEDKDSVSYNSIRAGKMMEDAARELLPHAQATNVVVTGNFRAWRHFIAEQAAPIVSHELALLARGITRKLIDIAPACFDDIDFLDSDGDNM